MNALLLGLTAIIAMLSFYGGVWLWKAISHSLSFSFHQLFVGAAFLLLSCLLVSFFLFDRIYLKDDIGVSLPYFVCLLTLSLNYNCGYLFSILPGRLKENKFSGLFRFELPVLLSPIILFIYIAKNTFNNSSEIYFFIGLFFFTSGFLIWENLRQAKVFSEEGFRKTLWVLSLGFVLVCALVGVFGLISFYVDAWVHLAAWSILMIFVSLSFYCVGLLFALIRFKRSIS